jgi:hypothetical protein
MNATATFELENDVGLEISGDVTVGTPPSWDDPGDGGEVDLEQHAEVTVPEGDGYATRRISLDDAIAMLASDRNTSHADILTWVENRLMDVAIERFDYSDCGDY